MSRRSIITAFLADSNWADALHTPLAQDASFRRYIRLHHAGSTVMLMDAPPPENPVALFASIAEHLNRLSQSAENPSLSPSSSKGSSKSTSPNSSLTPFCAPQIIAQDDANGLLLLEDFGDDTFTRALAAGENEHALYTLATTALIALHRHPKNADIDLPAYTPKALLGEAQLFTDWFYPALTGTPASAQCTAEYLNAWAEVCDHIHFKKDVLVLRDFHIDNAMLLTRCGQAVCGLLDFQDAVIGSPAYDLVSLLEDARRDVSDAVRAAMLTHYHQASDFDAELLMQDYAILGCQRHCKVAGIFMRLHQRDGKSHYLPHLPRVLNLIKRHIDQPALMPVKQWFNRYLPLASISLESLSVESLSLS